MSRKVSLATVLASLLVVSFAATGCASTIEGEEEEEEVAETEEAYTGRLAEMVRIGSSYPGAPRSWEQPPSEGIFGQNGYCGATAAANLLSWYGKNVSPRNAIDDGCWSYIGTRPITLARYLQNHHASLGCSLGRMSWNADALTGVRNSLREGRPLVVVFMTGRLEAHWVTIMGVRGRGDDPKLVVMSWGGFYTVQWSDFREAWRAGYSGPYPYIQCTKQSPLASNLRVDG